MNWWTATGGRDGPAALTAPMSARAKERWP
jgi:hypothetical protein